MRSGFARGDREDHAVLGAALLYAVEPSNVLPVKPCSFGYRAPREVLRMGEYLDLLDVELLDGEESFAKLTCWHSRVLEKYP